MNLKTHLALLLSVLGLRTAQCEEPREWNFPSSTDQKSIRASLWSYHEGNGFVTLKLASPAAGTGGNTFLTSLKDMSAEDQAFVKAAKVSKFPAKAGIPPQPDVLGFALLKSANEVSALLKKQGFQIDDTLKAEPVAAIAARRSASIRGGKPLPQQPGTVVYRIRAHKNEETKQLQLSFEFVEDISVTPPVARCFQITFNQLFSRAVNVREAREEMKLAVIEKYGTPVSDDGGPYYADNVGGGGEGPDENAPNFRFIKFRLVDGYLTLNDVGYQRQKLGLKKKLLDDITQSSKIAPRKTRL